VHPEGNILRHSRTLIDNCLESIRRIRNQLLQVTAGKSLSADLSTWRKLIVAEFEVDRPVRFDVKTIHNQLLGVRESDGAPHGGDLEISDWFRHDTPALFVTRLPFVTDIAYFGILGKKNHVPWRPRIDARKLKRQANELTSKLLRTREALEISERRRRTMEIVLTARLNRISELNDRLERVRAQNGKLEAEAEHLAQLFRESAVPARR
jgi:hypothetical protein